MDTAIIAVVVGVIIVLLVAAVSRAKATACPKCGAQAPAFRTPTSLRQMLWGGWTCASCGCEIDRSGKPIASTTTKV